MTYDEAIRFWHGRVNFEVRSARPKDLSLGLMNDLLTYLGDPQNAAPVVHIAGTKGKGSTAAMIAAIAQTTGMKVGLFTSPHLANVRERFQINGTPISESDFASVMAILAAAIEAVEESNGTQHTFFEIATALAWQYFRSHEVDLAVMEVGLGGRFDSTNVCKPLVSVITNIGYDHMAQLGETLEKIAFQKAGITKANVPCVVGPMSPGPLAVIREVARDVGAPLVEVTEPYRGTVNLLGEHQRMNAALAFEVARIIHCSDAAVVRGLANVQWPARIQVLRRDPAVILDCAHNVPSVESLVRTLREEFPSAMRRTCLLAVSSDKQYQEMLAILAGYFDRFVLTQYGNLRCLPPQSLADLLPVNVERQIAPTPAEACRIAREQAFDLLCVTGSVFLAGEVLARKDELIR